MVCAIFAKYFKELEQGGLQKLLSKKSLSKKLEFLDKHEEEGVFSKESRGQIWFSWWSRSNVIELKQERFSG